MYDVSRIHRADTSILDRCRPISRFLAPHPMLIPPLSLSSAHASLLDCSSLPNDPASNTAADRQPDNSRICSRACYRITLVCIVCTSHSQRNHYYRTSLLSSACLHGIAPRPSTPTHPHTDEKTGRWMYSIQNEKNEHETQIPPPAPPIETFRGTQRREASPMHLPTPVLLSSSNRPRSTDVPSPDCRQRTAQCNTYGCDGHPRK